MTIPKQDVGRDVDAYRAPNVQEFHLQAGIDYGTANENHNGPPTFSINPVTGTLIWDAPGAAGEYNISFQIWEWRKIGTVWVPLGYVTRDMHIHRAVSGPFTSTGMAGTTMGGKLWPAYIIMLHG